MPQTTSIKLNLALAALPMAAAAANLSRSGSFLLIFLIAAGVLVAALSTSNRLVPTWPSAALPLSGLWIALRPNYPDTAFDALFFALIVGVVACAVYVSESRSSAMISLHIGVGILLTAAVALQLVGIGAGGQQAISGNIITGGERVLFHLTGSLVSAPALAASYLVAGPPMLRFTRRYRILQLSLMAPAVFVLVQADRRSALFTAVLLVFGVSFAPRLLRRLAPSLVGFALIAPPVIGTFPKMWDSLGPFFASIVVLEREGQLDPIGGRLGIWTKSINFYYDRVDGFHQMFGFGTFGQAVSGASSTYSSTRAGSFGSLARERLLTTPHSSVMQLLLNGGWVVVIGVVAAVVYSAWVFSRRNTAADLGGLAMIAALSAVGFSEAALSPALGSPVWWTLLLLVTIALSRESSGGQRAEIKNAERRFGQHSHDECAVANGIP